MKYLVSELIVSNLKEKSKEVTQSFRDILFAVYVKEMLERQWNTKTVML